MSFNRSGRFRCLSQTTFSIALALLALTLGSLAAAQDWLPVGPDGGDVRSLAYDPQNPDHVLLGTSAGQLFSSNDGGASWSRLAHLGDGDDYVLDHIVFHPQDGSIYVAAKRCGRERNH